MSPTQPEQKIDPEKLQLELKNIKSQIQAMSLQITTLQRENNDLKRLINDHAARINKNTQTAAAIDRNFRNEINRVAAGFKRIQNLLKRSGE